MRHRLVSLRSTGLGNPDPCLLDNQWTAYEDLNDLLKVMFIDANHCFFHQCVDFKIELKEDGWTVAMGYEPAYMYEKLRIVKINSNKGDSFNRSGFAWEGYGTGIASTTKYYSQYQKKSKFAKFVDKWHDEIANWLAKNSPRSQAITDSFKEVYGGSGS